MWAAEWVRELHRRMKNSARAASNEKGVGTRTEGQLPYLISVTVSRRLSSLLARVTKSDASAFIREKLAGREWPVT